MNEKLTDERISAYLDDELSAEERADIERQLAESADLRLAVEELRALHAGMQSLPRYKLESSIADRVLQLAEREILVGGRSDGARSDAGQDAGGTTGTNGQSVSPSDNRPQPASLHASAPLSQHESVRHEAWFSWRNLVWSASAAAVAALVTNYYHVKNPTYSSAQPSVAIAHDDPNSGIHAIGAAKDAKIKDSVATKDRAGAGADTAAATQAAEELRSAASETSRTRSAVSKKPGSAADANLNADRAAGAARAEAFHGPTRGGNSSDEAPDTTIAADSAAGASSLAQRRSRDARSSKPEANSQFVEENPGFDGGAGGTRSAADGKPAGDLAMNDEAASATFDGGRSQQFLGGLPTSATTNVVTLAVSPEAWQGREFDKLLIANRVAMVGDASDGVAPHENPAGRAGLSQDNQASNGGASDRGSAAEEMFVLDVTQEQFAELLKAVDVRSDAFAVIKEFAVDEVASAYAADAGAAAPSEIAPSAADADPTRSVAAAPSIAQGALRSTDASPKGRGTPGEANPMRFSRGSVNPSPGAASPNALPPAAIEAPADAPRSVDPAPMSEEKAMPEPKAMPEEQSPPLAKASETKPDDVRSSDVPTDKSLNSKSPAVMPSDAAPAPAPDSPSPPKAEPESPKPDSPQPDSPRPESQKDETPKPEMESANAASPAPRSSAGEGKRLEKKAEGKSLRQEKPATAVPPPAAPDAPTPESVPPQPKNADSGKSFRAVPRDDAAKEKRESSVSPEGFARRIVPRPRTAPAEARSTPSRYRREDVAPPLPAPHPAAPNKAIPEAAAEAAQGDAPANTQAEEPNRKQVVDGPAENSPVDRVAASSPRVRVYFLLRPTHRVPARTELAAPGDAATPPIAAPPAPAAEAGPAEAAPTAPGPM